MDNFLEHVTNRYTSTDLIKANQQADAAMLDSAKDQLALFENQMEKVDTALSDMRQVNLKNIETAQEIQNLTKDSTSKITSAVNNVENESVSRIKQTSDLSIAGINKTIDESLAKIAEIKESADSIEAIKECVDVISQKIDGLRKDMEESSHADHVRIYRNVQAAMVEEFNKRTEEIIEAGKKRGPITPLLVITLIISLASLVLNILNAIGIF